MFESEVLILNFNTTAQPKPQPPKPKTQLVANLTHPQDFTKVSPNMNTRKAPNEEASS